MTVNGQPEEETTKGTSDAADKKKAAKTPEGKVDRKRERAPRKEIKV